VAEFHKAVDHQRANRAGGACLPHVIEIHYEELVDDLWVFVEDILVGRGAKIIYCAHRVLHLFGVRADVTGRITEADPAMLRILARSEQFRSRYDAAKQTQRRNCRDSLPCSRGPPSPSLPFRETRWSKSIASRHCPTNKRETYDES
jgi:hypothetical protein